MFFKNHMHHKSCAAGLSAAVIAGLWYTLGYAGLLLAQQAPAVDKVLQYMPQLFIMLQFAPYPLMTGVAFNPLGFLIGLLQIFVMAFVPVWAATRLYEWYRSI